MLSFRLKNQTSKNVVDTIFIILLSFDHVTHARPSDNLKNYISTIKRLTSGKPGRMRNLWEEDQHANT